MNNPPELSRWTRAAFALTMLAAMALAAAYFLYTYLFLLVSRTVSQLDVNVAASLGVGSMSAVLAALIVSGALKHSRRLEINFQANCLKEVVYAKVSQHWTAVLRESLNLSADTSIDDLESHLQLRASDKVLQTYRLFREAIIGDCNNSDLSYLFAACVTEMRRDLGHKGASLADVVSAKIVVDVGSELPLSTHEPMLHRQGQHRS